ncbi:MAG TPA: radical SAM protein [bacterium]|nr:radical SAM protein [bacterium]
MDSSWFSRTVPRKPTNLLWEITDACNLRCLHCEASAGRKRENEFTADEADELCRRIVAMKWQRVNLTGGEPLLRRDWPHLARQLADGGIHVTLVTNGLLFDEKIAAQAVEAGVKTVAVSIDGLRATHDRIRPRPEHQNDLPSCFDAAIAALRRAKDAGLTTAAITHVNLWNFGEREELHRLLHAERVDGWQIQLGVPLGRLREVDEPYLLPIERLAELEEFCAQMIRRAQDDSTAPAIAVMHTIGYYGKNEMIIRRGARRDTQRFFVGCVGGWRALAITSDGMVKPCAILPREFAVGNVREESLETIWNDRDRFTYQAHWDAEDLEGYCAECRYRFICRAGCTAMAYALTGTIYNNPYCLYRRAMEEHDA